MVIGSFRAFVRKDEEGVDNGTMYGLNIGIFILQGDPNGMKDKIDFHGSGHRTLSYRWSHGWGYLVQLNHFRLEVNCRSS